MSRQDMRERGKFIPMRLTEGERSILKVLENALEVSEYTDNVDVYSGYRKKKSSRMLEELVGVTGGVLVRAGATDAGLGGLLQRLSEAEKTDLETRTFREYRHRFWWFILPGAALLLLESFIRERRQRWSAPLNVLDE